VQAGTGPEGSRRMRLPDFMTVGTWRCSVCQPYAPAAFTPGNIPGTHFCWSLSRPQDHSAAGRVMSTILRHDDPNIYPERRRKTRNSLRLVFLRLTFHSRDLPNKGAPNHGHIHISFLGSF